MAPRLILVVFLLSLVAATSPPLESTALAAGLDAKGRAIAKEASGLYRQGRYEDAAKLFAQLIVDHPDMPIFERSLGACFYYLGKPEPALSNLRNYLLHRDDVPADDKAIVDRWIDEMEKLRTQNAVAAAALSVPTPAGSAEAPPMLTAPAAEKAAPAPSPVGAAAVPAAEPVAAQPPPVPAEAPVTDLPPPRAALDLSGPPAPGNSPAEAPRFYKRWWFWGTIGAVVVAGAVTAIVLANGKGGSNVPPTPLGNQEGI
jgi:hypothetical protein